MPGVASFSLLDCRKKAALRNCCVCYGITVHIAWIIIPGSLFFASTFLLASLEEPWEGPLIVGKASQVPAAMTPFATHKALACPQ